MERDHRIGAPELQFQVNLEIGKLKQVLNTAPLRKEHLEFFTKYWGHETMTSWNDSAESHASVWQHTLIIKKILQRLETKGALYAMF